MVEQEQTATFAEFARIAHFKPSYVSALRDAGRLAMTPDGKRVRVAASLDLIAATRDPSRAGVAARHAAARDETSAAADEDGDTPDGGEGTAADDGGEEAGSFASWRARRERAIALREERTNAVDEGKLMNGPDVVAALSAAMTQLRRRLETVADVVGSQLGDPQATSLIAAAIEDALAETSRAFHVLAGGKGR